MAERLNRAWTGNGMPHLSMGGDRAICGVAVWLGRPIPRQMAEVHTSCAACLTHLDVMLDRHPGDAS